MKKSLLIFIAFVFGLSLLSLACESGGGGNAVEITNSNAFDICEAYVSPVNQDTWGPNQLSAGEKIAPGAVLKLTGVAPGSYDLKFVNCDGTQEGKTQFTVP